MHRYHLDPALIQPGGLWEWQPILNGGTVQGRPDGLWVVIEGNGHRCLLEHRETGRREWVTAESLQQRRHWNPVLP